MCVCVCPITETRSRSPEAHLEVVALPVEELEKDGHTRDVRSEERGQQRKANNDRFRLRRFQVRGREELVWVSLGR